MSVIARVRRIAMPADALQTRSSEACGVHSRLVTKRAAVLLEAVDGRAQAGRDSHGKRPWQRPAGESTCLGEATLLAVDTQAREGKDCQSDVTTSATTQGFGPCHSCG
ncbi:hypothetical protein Y882_13340 [Dyella japonica DSM 16301]|uniref:Uncharacterized protein n=1 Tax=Dyella japonica DSM 16301 TaxID=1440762 RepID=A0A0G9GZP7_9GAMM|nr:hypothetical protein Y882_13340 [Dyella japonica DSM 16301]